MSKGRTYIYQKLSSISGYKLAIQKLVILTLKINLLTVFLESIGMLKRVLVGIIFIVFNPINHLQPVAKTVRFSYQTPCSVAIASIC